MTFNKVACRIANDWRGVRMMFPVRHLYIERDKAICEAFDGKNYAALAMQHGISEERIRQIVRAEDARRIARREQKGQG